MRILGGMNQPHIGMSVPDSGMIVRFSQETADSGRQPNLSQPRSQ
jgi:hypothetical protein